MSWIENHPWVVQYQYTKQSTGDLVWGSWKWYWTEEAAHVALVKLKFEKPDRYFRIRNETTGEIL